MRVAAYCRVSTNKSEQLDSLEAQQGFFTDYSRRNAYDLVKIYADEGKSGTKMKNRLQLLRLLSDAGQGLFEAVLIKDVSRLARNTVDFLTSVRRLKELGIKVIFVNYDQTSSDSSEFMLTMLSAIAQEESANISKRVKFGKKINAEKGRVPNLVYGYDKTPGDYFSLQINEQEARTVKRIYEMYTEFEIGESKIAMALNREGIKTKRGCNWSQNAVSRILKNEIYIGDIINCKQEVADFLTGKRREIDEENRITVHRPELRVITDGQFYKARVIMQNRSTAFVSTGERRIDKYIFSKLIKCKCCGFSFRRLSRGQDPPRIRWVCSGRNSNGADFCPNKTVIDEKTLTDSINAYLTDCLCGNKKAVRLIADESRRQYNIIKQDSDSEKELEDRLNRIIKARKRLLEMYQADVITLEELKTETKDNTSEIDNIKARLQIYKSVENENDIIDSMAYAALSGTGSIISRENISSDLLSRIIERIESDEKANVDIFFRFCE